MMWLMVLALAAAQAEVSSVYTELSDCGATQAAAPVNALCDGYAGWPVHIRAGEHGAALAYSDRARDEHFLQDPFSDGRDRTVSPTIEWRVRRTGGDWTPFATIHRWSAPSSDMGSDTGADGAHTRTEAEILVVSVLRDDGPIGACHAAYLDVAEVYDANTVARRFADLLADEFRCGVDSPHRIGAGEAALLMERGRF